MSASPPTSSAASRPSRGAARKANETLASYKQNLPDDIQDDDDLLREALAPMKDVDRAEYKAWVEMESDPAYFSGVLKDLGVEDVKVQEMFEVTQEAVEQLPQPVYGFVFCCRYEGEDQEGTEEAPQDLWFANQTMPNGCATVALINIVMNNPVIELGPTLTAFKASTAPLTPLVRGYRLDSHPRIRQTHNAFARRIEHLNADLSLQNEYDEEEGDPDAAAAKRANRAAVKRVREAAKKKQAAEKQAAEKKQATAATTASSNKRRISSRTSTSTTTAAAAATAKELSPPPKPKPRRKPMPADTCHYKAFLPALNQVWVLDGLEANPVSLPLIPTDSDVDMADAHPSPPPKAANDNATEVAAPPAPWTTTAIASIQAKMAYAGDFVNILAVCQSPTHALRAQLTANIANLELARARCAVLPPRNPEVLYCSLTDDLDDQGGGGEEERLAAFGITEAAVRARMAAQGDRMDIVEGHDDEGAAVVAAEEARQRELVVAFNTEVMNAEGDKARCEERKEDFAAAIHTWVEKLAAQGVLQALAEA